MNSAGTSYESSLLLTLEEISRLVSHSHDPADDFNHPLLAEGHPLRRHVLYRTPKRVPALS